MVLSPRTCVIGAGSSGIAAAKVLHERGVPFDCYELSDRVGGNWVFGNANGISASYRSLHINTSRERMEFSDFPMPKRLPDFPRHDHIAAYFDDYVDHFGFRDRIRFRTAVEHVTPLAGGGFDVRLGTGATERYDAVVVCNGHHWDPRWPEPAFPGAAESSIEQLHSHSYTEEEQLAGKDVVVLGMGNSAMDIAVDASYHARSVYLAHRRGAHIVPKYVFGKPVDQLGGQALPGAIRWPVIRTMLRLVNGDLTQYGLQQPDHKFGQAHPTVSGRILDRLAHGAITPKPNIARLEDDEVVFEDGSRVHADLVVYCTGYKITFPFFDEDVVAAHDNRLRLFEHVVHPGIDRLYFIGLVQPLGAIMPIAERQSQLVANHLTGVYALPSRAEVERSIDAKQEAMRKRYVASKRHTIQVDFEDYMRELQQEMDAGAARAEAGPVPA
ncbi:NAD(P)/FAD-dependent oxidoreductase [Conexibacter sp. SYSU D00693]|uniref:flavin-containing monooxygenase n=1 Tax=Conexibacter sp. SYSU D00693 TaxID=2812560 RepID=UPI00196A95FD|nr:NAD(P)-binding domain-containing protein [Conexibacter sp. SYSU D00693]